MSEIVVPDASVLLKWALDAKEEGDKNQALDILDAWIDGRIEIILPKIWVFEVGNVLMIKNRELALEIMEVFVGYNFSELDTTIDVCKETFKLMRKYNVTFYDAVYHVVAILNNGTFITADESYWRKTKDIKNIIRLRDWT